jgi:hypothetical protein
MPRISMKTAHALGKEEARRRLEARLCVARSAYGSKAMDLREEWNEGTLSFDFETMGTHVTGMMVVRDDEVRLAAEVPLRVALFKRYIEKRIRAELGDLLT